MIATYNLVYEKCEMVPIVNNYMKTYMKIPKRLKDELIEAKDENWSWEWQDCIDSYYDEHLND